MHESEKKLKEAYILTQQLEESVALLHSVNDRNIRRKSNIRLEILINHIGLLSQELQDTIWKVIPQNQL